MADEPGTEHDTTAEAAQEEALRDFDASRDIRHEGDPPEGVKRILEAAANGKLTDEDKEQQQDAMDWLLERFDTPDEEAEARHTMRLNVGGLVKSEERWIKWTIRNVDGGLLRKLRESAMGGRRGGGNVDLEAVYQSNLQVILAGTVYPPLRDAARMRALADPAMIVEEAFKTKPGLVEAIAGAVMDLSGYDPDATRDEREVAAAGNS